MVIALIRQAGLPIHAVLATSDGQPNPHVMICGDLERTQDHSMAAPREHLCELTQPLAVRGGQVLTSIVGDRPGIFGAVRLVDDTVFSTEPADRMLAG